jgi:hypothetical protein
MKDFDKKACIEEEIFIVLHSGEIPEVTYHGSLYYLGEDPTGPGLLLNSDDTSLLKQAVVKRYRAIILRDIDPENRDKRIYRGLARCIANWQRLLKFCAKEKLDFQIIQNEAATALKEFLNNEIDDVLNGDRSSCINCSAKEIETLINSLGLSMVDLPERWQELCPAG